MKDMLVCGLWDNALRERERENAPRTRLNSGKGNTSGIKCGRNEKTNRIITVSLSLNTEKNLLTLFEKIRVTSSSTRAKKGGVRHLKKCLFIEFPRTLNKRITEPFKTIDNFFITMNKFTEIKGVKIFLDSRDNLAGEINWIIEMMEQPTRTPRRKMHSTKKLLLCETRRKT